MRATVLRGFDSGRGGGLGAGAVIGKTVRAGDAKCVDHIWTMTTTRRQYVYTHRGNDDRSHAPLNMKWKKNTEPKI